MSDQNRPDQNNSDCQQISEMLSAFRDMELTLEEVDLVEAHLEGCPVCKRQLAEIEMVIARLQSLPAPAEIDFADAIEARIKAASVAGPSGTGPSALPKEPEAVPVTKVAALSDNVRPFARPAKRSPVMAIAAVAAALFLGFAVTNITMVPRQPAEMAQTPRVQSGTSQLPGKSLESEKSGAPLSEDVVALYDEEGASSAADAGISTNEDGLYAIKM